MIRLSSIWSLAAATILAMVAVGCASYTDHTREAQRQVVQGNVDGAILLLNEHLDVHNGPAAMPNRIDDDRVLFLLERATLLQAIGDYESASRDMVHIDDHLEWVDFTSEAADRILRMVYSDDAGDYRAPPHERLLLNTMNMINFLAMGNANSARVEARRFNVMQEFYLQSEPDTVSTQILGLGNYLAGAAFEASDQFSTAARFYANAYGFGVWPEETTDRLVDLTALTGYRGAGVEYGRERYDAIVEQSRQVERPNRSEYKRRWRNGDTLMVIQTGLVPYRQAERIGMERALTYTSDSRHAQVHFGSSTQDEAMMLATAGTLNWLNTTSLTTEGLPDRRRVTVHLDDHSWDLDSPVHLSEQIVDEWQDVALAGLAAGITRAVARIAAGEGSRRITESVAESSGRSEGSSRLLGWLVGSAVSTTMAVADTPDTRSWTSLPADIHLVRTQLRPGTQSVRVQVNGQRDEREVDVQENRFQLLNFSRHR